MPDKKDDGSKGGGVPVWFGQVAAVTGGGILGHQGGEALGHVISERLGLPSETAEKVEDGLELAGAGLVAFAGLQLAKQNPNKSVFVGAKAIAGAAALAGAETLVEKITTLGKDVTELKEEIHSMAQQPNAENIDLQLSSHSDLFNSMGEPAANPYLADIAPPLQASGDDHAWKDIHSNWSDADIFGNRPHDTFGNPEGRDIYGGLHDVNGHPVDTNHDHQDSAFNDHPSSDI